MSKMKELDGMGCRACGEPFDSDWHAWVIPATGELVVSCPCCHLEQLPEELAPVVEGATDSYWENEEFDHA